MTTSESFINLNADSTDATLLKYRAVTPADVKQAITNGRIAGGAYSFIAGIVAIIYASIVPEDDPLVKEWYFWIILLVVFILSIYYGGIVRRRKFETESVKGYLRIDASKIEYWIPRGTKTIDMSRIFGAGAEDLYPDTGLRLCILDSSNCGYTTMIRSFKNYVIVEGPLAGTDSGISDGDKLASDVIRYYVKQRRESGMHVAEIPPYKFDSKIQHHEHLIFGEHVLDASFGCDGETVSIFTKGVTHNFPVHAVRNVKINKTTYKGSPTKWDITLAYDTSYGNESIFLDILNMSNNEEIENYVVCLPNLFSKDDLTTI
jgi:hypothetical protein